MKKLLIALLGLFISMSLGLSGAYAAKAKDHSMNSMNTARESGKFMRQATGNEFKANDIIGAKVEGRDGKDIGTIENLAVDPKTDRVAFAVIGHGGVAGVGEKDFAVPLKSLSLRRDENGKIKMFVLNMSEDQIAKAPAFDNNSWPGMRSSEKSGRSYGKNTTSKSSKGESATSSGKGESKTY